MWTFTKGMTNAAACKIHFFNRFMTEKAKFDSDFITLVVFQYLRRLLPPSLFSLLKNISLVFILKGSHLVRGPVLGVFISLLSLSSSDLLSAERLSSISSLSCFSTFSSRVEGTCPARLEVRAVISNVNIEVRCHTCADSWGVRRTITS